ncbi:bifunctional [glutamine synthetase] adenylyltransferase/[glutamine synthetase]-adenylyl-L-tyrosine phosphorylase [Hansschlegelia plantiphila]|uniref:Bifunctional glutamine synthetase adenylyltransferase/adenylyl-removing enzyme n=1 Tax=Hansschlegelia plantiphila TaxID=374655 RepID=A0A9W6J2N4_9HYPH|nr:bifunctional [glutamine synthetase] adenylyltransferase/[glutamine synthetase]-adenylyl-L-tyrosine phosphorylase [Hansschlegelia plantiphila]GLK68180.1 glutamate-ammonia-ligase adenylyltransferase [Hansschlegelia plantiphila]
MAELKSRRRPPSLAARLSAVLAPADAEAARRKVNELLENSEAKPLATVAVGGPARALLESVADGSPFLWGLIEREPERAARLLAGDPEARLAALTAEIGSHGSNRASLAAALRQARSEAALLIAIADIGGVWDSGQVTAALSDFAEAAIRAATSAALREAHDARRITLPDPDRPEQGCGFFIVGMGKLGARELNYSSDVDLIAFFDTQVVRVSEESDATSTFARVTQTMAKLLQERTADGYVARVDLRLRPDPGSTPVAISRDAALSYYESVGQNWERAAMIKARIVAGDAAAGEAFLTELRPFVWRRSLDHAAISDIHAMKRQIHVHKGHGEIAVEGHNLKLGRGGIREIEFFVQTQQLVAGGRDPALRTRGTVETLNGLVDAGWIDGGARDELAEAYGFLRTIEHRLQMVDDVQTHSLPEDEAALGRFAHFAGFSGRVAFAKALLKRMKIVQRHYARLFEDAPPLSVDIGSLVFTGEDDDPETLLTIGRLGYAEPSSVARTIREWHRGRYPSMKTNRARELLTELTPTILDVFARSDRPDAAINGLDKVLARTSAGVGLLALIRANPQVLELLAGVLGVAPRLAETLARRPRVLDALLDPAFFGHLPDRAELHERVAQALGEARSYEDALERARIVGQEMKTLVALRVAAGAAAADQAGPAFARTADVLIAALFRMAEKELARVHGRISGGMASVVALGKLGGEEMTAASDVDLILLYDHPDDAAESDGPKPLAPSQYYARLTQRLLAALSAPTAEGVLYEVDFRLRPSGRAGPLATRLRAFELYQAEEAETWEHMALSRARVIAGPKAFVRKVGRAIGEVLLAPRAPAKVAKDVAAMRMLLDKEKGAGGPWNLKHAPGGLVDVEFAAQALQLAYASTHPKMLFTATIPALDRAHAEGLLDRESWATLRSGARLQQDLTQALRLAIDGPFDPKEAGEGLRRLLARTGEAPDFAVLTATLADRQKEVRAAFRAVLAGMK